MRARRNTLNNMIMDRERSGSVYQTVITDLALEGIIPRDKAEGLLGYEIPSYLRSGSGRQLVAAGSAPEKKAADKKAAAPKKEEENEEETGADA